MLIVDDQPAVCTALQVLFEIHGYACVVADGPAAALACVRRGDVGVVVQDMNFTEDTTSGDGGSACSAPCGPRIPSCPSC